MSINYGSYYTPFQKYVPTEYLPMYQHNLEYMANREDKANEVIGNMYQDLNNTPVYDTKAYSDEVNNIKGKVDDVLNKYNGDPARAYNELVTVTKNSKNSQFWNLNKQALDIAEKQQNIQDQLKASGQNVLNFSNVPKSLKVKREDGTERWLTPQELNFDVQRQLDYTDQQGKLWDKALHEETSKAGLPKVLDPNSPFVQIAQSKGINDAQIQNKLKYIYDAYKDTPEYNQQKRKLQELEGLSPKDAENHVINDIVETGKSRKYLSEIPQVMRNPEFGRQTTTQSSLPFTATYNVNPEGSVEDVQKKIQNAKIVASGKTVGQDQVVTNSLADNPFKFGVPNLGRPKDWDSETKKANKDLEDYKKNYSMLFDKIGDTDKALDAIQQIETNKSKFKSLLWQHNDVDAQNYFNKSLQNFVDSKRNVKYNKLDESFNKQDETDGSQVGKIDASDIDLLGGRILLHNQSGSGKKLEYNTFEMNQNALPIDTQHHLDIASKVLNNSFNMNDASFKPVVDDKSPIKVGNKIGNLAYMKSPTNGMIYEVVVDKDNTPIASGGKPMTPEQFGQEMLTKVYTSLNVFEKMATKKQKRSLSEEED